jgi:hypothetical protein
MWVLLVVGACKASAFFEKEVKQIVASLKRGKFERGRRSRGWTGHLLDHLAHWRPSCLDNCLVL